MKVIVAGAGIGGLVAAAKLKKLGLEVTVLERAKSLEEMRYDWHDDVNPDVFEQLGITMPSESFKKKSWTFIAPVSSKARLFRQDESKADYSVERRPLNKTLFDLCEGVEFLFDQFVTGGIVEDGYVCGVVANGIEYRADFVVDSLGIDSPLRESLVKKFDLDTYTPDEAFMAYRAFYEKNDKYNAEYSNKVYLKYLGDKGIAWVIQDHNPKLVNVLIGRLEELKEETLKDYLNRIKKENPTVGEKILRGGIVCKIPVRYPSTMMVANGYAEIGDCAFMTIPMLGSGIASSMRAADLLAKTVENSMANFKETKEIFGKKSLWNYQCAVYEKFGAEHCAVDVLKRGVMKLDNEIVDYILTSELLTNDEVGRLASGKPIKLSVKDMIKKVAIAGAGRIPSLLKVNNMLSKSNAAQKYAKKIPKKYDSKKVEAWRKKLKAFYV